MEELRARILASLLKERPSLSPAGPGRFLEEGEEGGRLLFSMEEKGSSLRSSIRAEIPWKDEAGERLYEALSKMNEEALWGRFVMRKGDPFPYLSYEIPFLSFPEDVGEKTVRAALRNALLVRKEILPSLLEEGFPGPEGKWLPLLKGRRRRESLLVHEEIDGPGRLFPGEQRKILRELMEEGGYPYQEDEEGMLVSFRKAGRECPVSLRYLEEPPLRGVLLYAYSASFPMLPSQRGECLKALGYANGGFALGKGTLFGNPVEPLLLVRIIHPIFEGELVGARRVRHAMALVEFGMRRFLPPFRMLAEGSLKDFREFLRSFRGR